MVMSHWSHPLRKRAVKKWRFITTEIPCHIPWCPLLAHPHTILCASNITPQHSSLQDKLLWFYQPLSLHEAKQISCAPQTYFWEFRNPDGLFWNGQSKDLWTSSALFPLRVNGKISFPLCYSCPETCHALPVPCDEERALVFLRTPGNWARLCRRATGKFLQCFLWRGSSLFSNYIKLRLCTEAGSIRPPSLVHRWKQKSK